jgi:ribosome recycling factor
MIDAPLQGVLDEARQHMQKSLEHFAHELTHIRAGRANPTMVDEVRVEAYGQQMPLNQVASVSAPQADLIVIQPWDKSTLAPIERAIQAANLGFNPTNDGNLIRISLPPLTEERRKELAKSARAQSEDAKVAVRNVRRQAKEDIKKTTDAESLSEDMRYEAEEQLQKLTDEFTGRVDEILERKEKEILSV